ncbi:Ppx/GppA family phosphatase [Bacillus sp. FJAT-47783]|uniref:Ppx/GppA family phosphatase n=1 Tax=Bacillus sp. FJAT-47783 TaxID=2922712 RepID=UPI001FADCC1F|nr:Ppx/GppA family phosphatase [Bacillus sp. FJAT-47783]
MRLVIYVQDKSGRLKEIENVKAVARLRNYLANNGELSDEGIHVLVNTLKAFQEVTRFHNLTNIRSVATATIRQANNQNKILTEVATNTDFRVRVLSEYEEAYYGFLAVVNSTSFQEGITIDIGGGSSEVTYFKNRRLQEFHSFPFGALSLKKQFVKGNMPTRLELKAVKEFLQKEMSKLPWLKGKKLPIIAIGGSARNVVQIDQALKKYPLAKLHQYELNKEDIMDVKNYLTSLPFEKLQRVEGLSKDRADIIIPTTEVFLELCNVVETSSFLLSRKGLRDGVLYEEILQQFGLTAFPNVIEESFQELAVEYEIDIPFTCQVTNLLMLLAKQLMEANVVQLTKTDLQILRNGSFVYNLGHYVDSESSSQHTFYLLSNRTIDGLRHKEQLALALIASFKNHSAFKQYIEPFMDWFSKEEQRKLRLMGALIKFTYSLNATKRNIVQDLFVAHKDNETVGINVYCNQNWQPEKYEAEKQKKHLEKTLKQKIELNFKSIEEKVVEFVK